MDGCPMLEACHAQFSALTETHSWLKELRALAFQSFMRQGLPTTKTEAWRNTDVRALGQQHFTLTGSNEVGHTLSEEQHRYLEDWKKNADHLCVFVDGVYSPQYSYSQPASRVICTAFREGLRDTADYWKPYFERTLPGHTPGAFGALNTALSEEGCLLKVQENTLVEQPVYIVSFVTERSQMKLLHLQHRIVLGAGSQLSICTVYHGSPHIVYCMNTALHGYMAPNAELQHHKIQCESKQATHMASQYYYPDQDSRLISTQLNVGAQLARDEIRLHFSEPRSYAAFFGVNLTGPGQQADHYIRVPHAASGCESHQRYKSIVNGNGCTVFNSKIRVAPGTAGTIAHQKNDNRLLAAEAKAYTRPQLQIDSDDVQCTHGATVGQMDTDALFFLRSRGISEAQARELLMHAFVRDILAEVGDISVRALMESMLKTSIGGLQ